MEVGIDTKKDSQIAKPAGRRVQDLSLLAEGISELTCCKLCCGKLELVEEKNIQGLSSSLVWSCMSCKEELAIPTSHMIKSNIPKGKPRSEVNLLAVGGMEMIGKGYAGLNSFLTHLDIPSMSHTTFDKTALFIGKAAQQVVEESLNKAHVEEKEKLVQKGVQIDQHGNLVDEGITDAGWQKRSYNHNCNSLSGVGVLVGKETGKVMDFEVLTVNCKKCATAKTIGKEVEPHNCTALWKGSAKSMEPEMAARMWSRSGHYGINFSTQVGDEDSATQKKLQEEVPDNLKPTKKKSDFLHIKRNFTNHLYNLKSKYRGIMSKMVITKLVVDFSAAIKTNVGDANKIRDALQNIVSHNYGIHIKCGDWCLAKMDSSYKPKLPFGKYLSDEQLKKDLEIEIAFFTEEKTLAKIMECSSSQRAEMAFSILSKLAPKDTHLSSSPTLKRRMQYMVAKYNEGVAYSGLLWNKLGIKLGQQQLKSYRKGQKYSNWQYKHKQTEAYKIHRRVLKQQRSAKIKADKCKEVVQYKSGMGIYESKKHKRTSCEVYSSPTD